MTGGAQGTMPVGSVFGRLTTSGLAFSVRGRTQKQWHVVCRCQCGSSNVYFAKALLWGGTLSCGCFRADTAAERATRHGDACAGQQTELYRKWVTMLNRCRDVRNLRYGGRGITVCKEWVDSYEEFKHFAIEAGWQHGLTIERIDVNGHYVPNNVTFIPRCQQSRNQTTTRRLTAFGECKPVSYWVKDPRCRVKSYRTIQRRMAAYGWSAEEAMTAPRALGRNKPVRVGRHD